LFVATTARQQTSQLQHAVTSGDAEIARLRREVENERRATTAANKTAAVGLYKFNAVYP
jgi:outer membrane murein-binding lipoprotein Lpp